MNLNAKLNLVFQPIGLLCALLVLISIAGLAVVDKRLTNRMTVRLIAAIAFADILSHIGEIYAAANGRLPLASSLCSFVNGFRVFSRNFYCFTNIAICFHLYRSLVLLKKSTWRFELYTYIATIFMVTIFTLIYWSFGAFSGVKNKVGCNPGSDDYTLNKVYLLTAGFINVITFSLGIFTTVASHRNLNKYINVYSVTLTEQGENHDLITRERRKMAVRSFLYPLATCVTLPFEAIFIILYGFGLFVFQLGYPTAATLGLSGLLTGIAFAVDPATHSAFRSAYYQLKNRKHSKKEFDNYQFNNPNDIPLKVNQ
jgi:hypothetical protein